MKCIEKKRMALLTIESADIIFLAIATLIALVVVLLSNPLTSWVNRMVGKGNGNTDKRK